MGGAEYGGYIWVLKLNYMLIKFNLSYDKKYILKIKKNNSNAKIIFCF